jgi:hypothetical protein
MKIVTYSGRISYGLVIFLAVMMLFNGCDKSESNKNFGPNKPRIKPMADYDNSNMQYIWSVGIYRGSSPFLLHEFSDTLNPVIDAASITDIDAKFVADPFVIQGDTLYYMFFEVLNQKSNKGDVGYATSIDGFHWEYKQIVLSERFHLSYPYVFKSNNEFYMVPETHLDSSVRLYKASHFPDQWEYVRSLVKGKSFVDPCIVFYNNRWWLFVSIRESNVLYLYSSAELNGEWKEHPLSPIVTDNYHFARPGGRMFEYNDNLYRFSQDDSPYYGIQVWAFRINELTVSNYSEELVSDQPVVKYGTDPWNIHGMHQVDIFMEKEGYWYAVVDGNH